MNSLEVWLRFMDFSDLTVWSIGRVKIFFSGCFFPPSFLSSSGKKEAELFKKIIHLSGLLFPLLLLRGPVPQILVWVFIDICSGLFVIFPFKVLVLATWNILYSKENEVHFFPKLPFKITQKRKSNSKSLLAAGICLHNSHYGDI